MKVKKHPPRSKRFRIVMYSVMTLILTCLIVTGYYLVSNGVIFGKYVAQSPYIEQQYVDNPDTAMPITEDELTVTAKNEFSSLKTASPLLNLPEVPHTNGTVQKGTKENPLVILEIVPELAQQSMSYLVANEEEGLPFNALEVGRAVTQNKNRSLVKQLGVTNINNIHVPSDSWDYNIEGTCLRDLGGWFDNNNNGAYTIYNPNGTVVGADHKTSTDHDDDRSRAPLAYLDAYYTVELKRDMSFASELSGGSTTDSRKKISDLKAAHADFVDVDGQDIPTEIIQDDANWAWSNRVDSSDNKNFTVKVTGTEAFDEDVKLFKNNQLTFTQLATKYPDNFKTADSGDEIRDVDIARTTSWKLENEKSNKAGYIVYVGENKGDFNYLYSWDEKLYHMDASSTRKNDWIYVATKDELPSNYKEIWSENQSWWSVNAVIYGNSEVGVGFPASRLADANIYVQKDNSVWKTLPSTMVYTFRYQYQGYVFKFEYVGLRFNDILKRMFFWYKDDVDDDGKVIKTADEKYDETYIKVIALTPSMINQMDAGDTAATLDYVERADMFFVSSYYCDENQSADSVDKLLQFYYDYVDPERATNHKTFEKGKMASFYENDLEWVDCMKIIRRLSGDPSLPMMFSKQMGYMLDEGVKRDNTKTSHMYVTDTNTCKQSAGSLNNLAKLYLISTQYNLSAKKEKPGSDQNGNPIVYTHTFMDDLYYNIKQVPIETSSAGDRDPNSAKYTGFYKRSMLAGCGDADTRVKENAYYLWNIYTFIPVISSTSTDSLFNGVEINLDNFLKHGFLESSIRNPQYVSSIKNGGGDYGKIPGTKDPENDYQNVAIAGGASANTNFVIFNNGTMSENGVVIYEIFNNGTPESPVMKFSVLNSEDSRKYYQRLSNSSVLIDYSQEAEYKSNKTLYLHTMLDNQENEESSILTRICLKSSDESKNLPEIKVDPSRIDGAALVADDIGFSQTQSTFAKVFGYPVSKSDILRFRIPFTLTQWQQGYDTVRVEWVARTSRVRGASFEPFQNPTRLDDENIVAASKQYAEVTIGERGIFDLQ